MVGVCEHSDLYIMGNTVPDNLIHPTVKYEDHCPRYIHTGRQKLPSNTLHYGRHCSR